MDTKKFLATDYHDDKATKLLLLKQLKLVPHYYCSKCDLPKERYLAVLGCLEPADPYSPNQDPNQAKNINPDPADPWIGADPSCFEHFLE